MSHRTQTTAGWQWLFLLLTGGLTGAALSLNLLAFTETGTQISTLKLAVMLLAAGNFGAAGCCVARMVTVHLVSRANLDQPIRARFLNLEIWSYLIFFIVFVGAAGVRFNVGLIGCILAAWIAIKAILLIGVLPKSQRGDWFASLPYLAFLFFISGFAALIYQIVWQRVLFASYGINIESITIIVSLFMFGLGVGSLIGGVLSRKYPDRSPMLFLTCEVIMGLFGLVSIPLIERVAHLTLNGNLTQITLAIYALLCLPTILMGATLPILVNHLYRHYQNVGKSVGILYFINTLGSAVACIATAEVLFVYGGQQLAVIFAAICNLTVGVLVNRYATRLAKLGARRGAVAA